MKKLQFAIFTLGILLMLIGCRSDEWSIPDHERGPWTGTIEAFRSKKNYEFTHDATSPMAATDWFELVGSGPHGIRVNELGLTHGSAEEADYRILQESDGQWFIKGPDGESRPFPFESPVEVGDRFALVSYETDDGMTIRVFDRERPAYTEFKSLKYFDPDPDYAVMARVERLNSPENVEMTTSRNRIKTYLRVARLHFRLRGEEQTLAAYKMSLDGPYSNMYFIPFRDATSGSETYGAGRFLELYEPEGDTMILDFNRAFNPLCNYSPAYNCPLPPAENTLLIPIRAGERTYPHHMEEERNH